ncbi:ribosomal RNA-processing protein 7-domain-containing protein [Tuber brumale]|nr:ribosomal RNA-processing protein 7-domain-containing protein [Tuber brumale]
MTSPAQIPNFTIFPITLPATLLVGATTHYLYLRKHAPKQPTPHDPRSLFVVNVPIDATTAHFRALFTGIGGGRVEKVIFARVRGATPAIGKRKRHCTDEDEDGGQVWDTQLRNSGSTAVVVFVDKPSMDVAIKEARKFSKKRVVWGDGISERVDIPALGIPRYLAYHNLTHPSKPHLQASANTFIAAFEAEESARLRALAKRRQEPDEDGFIAVVRGGRTAPARQEEAKAALEKKGKDKHEGFYRFQARQERKNRQMELLKKFEEDKKRVADRKNLRTFKPL